MKKNILLYTIFILFTLSNSNAFSQAGIKYSDFAKKLEIYFHPDLISDITEEFPRTDFTVWGWDVGDFSDDGNNDVAFCIRRSGAKDKIMEVYVFTDIDGYLVKIAQPKYEFIETPLEVGVAFRYGVLYVTQKFKQFNWKIEGFKFINGSFLSYDQYITSRGTKLTNERYRNYYNLRNSEKHLVTTTGKTEFWADYITIPVYSRGRLIYKGITSAATVNVVEFVPDGAYWWEGENDLSFTVSSAYDNEYLYFTISVTDDNVVRPYNNIINGESIEIIIDATDFTNNNNRFIGNKDEKTTTPKTPLEIYKFNILVGDFVHKEPVMTVTANNQKVTTKQNTLKSTNVVADLTDNGYYVICKIAFADLGKQKPPINDVSNDVVEWGCTVSVIDVDNEFRPERKTILQTSLFEEGNPATLGTLAFIPDDKWYGESFNIYEDKIIRSLEEAGY